ncbi:hypothetical protein WJX75_002836 [Coccomyxa subellipsoidea]|uniref:Uncharacterized protein n=1 Tax=Coccomyxa subellipsoidea TaxID=248742 RepID=A0ABR2YSY0_9CHLO
MMLLILLVVRNVISSGCLLFFQLFSTPVYWTRLDVSHNRNFCLPESRFALDCFNYVVRRNPLRVLNFDHTGFTNADIQGLLRILLLNASSIKHLQILKIGPPGSELADSIMQAALRAGLERDESETEYLRLKRMGFLEGDEHFREFDPNVLQPVMDAQMEAPEKMEVRPEDSPVHRYGDLGRDAVQHDQPRGFACAISNTAGPQPLGRIRERGAPRTSHRHEKRRRRPSNRGAGAGQAPGDSADSAEYSPRAHEELLHTRLEVREISGGSPDSNGADARLDSPARSLLSPAAAASPLVLSPAARTKGAAIAARQPQKPRRATVNDGSPRNAPRRKSREPPSTPVPEGLEAFGWESRESAEKHPPKGVFEKPKEPKRARKRLPQTEEALRRLLEQRAGRHAGSHANDASDSPHSQSNGNEPSDAERSDHEVVVEARAGRRLHILESEDQELANVAVLDSRELAGSDRVGEPAEQMHVHDAHEPPEASPAYHSLGSQQQHSMDDVRDSPKATFRRRSSGTAAASSSDQSASAAGQPEHEASPDRRDPAGERGSAEAASPSALQGEPPRVGEMNARTRRELAALMPFSWDRLADRHPANTERMGVSLVENMGSRRCARASANREEDPGSSDEEEPEDNVPLANEDEDATG